MCWNARSKENDLLITGGELIGEHPHDVIWLLVLKCFDQILCRGASGKPSSDGDGLWQCIYIIITS
jgi:hypothetical protein